MANPCAFRPATTWQALLFFISVIAVEVASAGGQDDCPSFSCGDLRNVTYPFRRQSDPPACGVPAYELVCSNSKAAIRINTGTYFVTNINYTYRYFWVLDANLDMHSSCPRPRWDQLPYSGDGVPRTGSHWLFDLATDSNYWACFVNCSQAITNISWYKPVSCLTTNSSFVYVSVTACHVQSLDPSCGYLAMIPFGNPYTLYQDFELTSGYTYTDIINKVKKGFSVHFPLDFHRHNASWIFKTCRNNYSSYFHNRLHGTSILNWTRAFFWSEVTLAECANYYPTQNVMFRRVVIAIVSSIILPSFILYYAG